jgi:cytochrome c biogenesis protein CcdA
MVIQCSLPIAAGALMLAASSQSLWDGAARALAFAAGVAVAPAAAALAGGPAVELYLGRARRLLAALLLASGLAFAAYSLGIAAG